MFSSLSAVFDRYRTIIKNSFFLSIVDGIKMLLPFIAMPYIIKVCGVENFGRIIFAQTIIGYFTIVVNFGLNIFAVREVANNAGDCQKLSRIASTFIALRLLLFSACLAVLLILLATVPFFREFRLLLLFAFAAVLAETFSMTAFFQGLEKMQNIAILQFVSIIFYVSTLFIFVREKSSYEIVPLLQATGLVISALLGVFMLRFKYNIRITLPCVEDMRSMFKSSFPFAMSRIAIIINTNTANFFTGLALGMQELAVLDIVQKISGVATLPVSIIDQSVYPHNAKQKDRNFATKTFFYVLVLGCICAGIMAVGTAPAVQFFGQGKLDAAIPLVYIMSIKVIATTLTLYTGAPVLVAFGYPKPFNMSTIWLSLLTIVIYPAMYCFNCLSLNMVIALIILSELFYSAYRTFYCIKYKLLFNINEDKQ